MKKSKTKSKGGMHVIKGAFAYKNNSIQRRDQKTRIAEEYRRVSDNAS